MFFIRSITLHVTKSLMYMVEVSLHVIILCILHVATDCKKLWSIAMRCCPMAQCSWVSTMDPAWTCDLWMNLRNSGHYIRRCPVLQIALQGQTYWFILCVCTYFEQQKCSQSIYFLEINCLPNVTFFYGNVKSEHKQKNHKKITGTHSKYILTAH